MSYFTETMGNLLHQTAFFNLTWGNFVMILVACIGCRNESGKTGQSVRRLPETG